MSERGKYLVIEGHDATGKSTQADRLARNLGNRGVSSLRVDEPGGSEMAQKLRELVKYGPERAPLTDVMLFQTSRVDMWQMKAEPALEAGTHVIASRNIESTKVYQGLGDGIDLELIDQLNNATMPANYLHPSKFLLLLLLDDAERERRLGGRAAPEKPDVFESRDADFQHRVYDGYLQLAQKPGVTIVDASGNEDEVEVLIWDKTKTLFGKRS